MLCNEAHRRAVAARNERDKTRRRLINICSRSAACTSRRRREYTGDLVHSLLYAFVPAHALIPDHDDDLHLRLVACKSLSRPLDERVRSLSLPDLIDASVPIRFDPLAEKRHVRARRLREEILFDDADYESDMEDPGIRQANLRLALADFRCGDG